MAHRHLIHAVALIAGTFGLIGNAAATDALDKSVYPNRMPSEEAAPYKVETVLEGLDYPWSLSFLPGGDMLITEKPGTLWRVGDDGAKTKIKGVPDVYYDGQGGLLDVAVPEMRNEANVIFLSYSAGTPDANATHLMRAVLSGDTLMNSQVLFVAKPDKATAVHFGGKIAFLPDGSLLMTVGEGFRYREQAQKLDTHLGKIVRLNRDGSVPANNPFVGSDMALPEIYSLGHRNEQGLVVDYASGRIWEHEHGARGGDEINLLKPGVNYGWPIVTTGVDYSGARVSPYTTLEGYQDPVYDWVPSIAPSGLAIYRGSLFPDWDGDLLVGGLASADLRRLDMNGDTVVGETILLNDLGERIRDVKVGPDGAIYVLTDSEDGKLLKITPK